MFYNGSWLSQWVTINFGLITVSSLAYILYWRISAEFEDGVSGKIMMCVCVYRCPRRNVPDFGRVFLMLKYTDITQNTYVQSWTVTEIMAREKCGLLAGPHTIPVSWQSYPFPSLSVVSYDGNSAYASHSQPCYVTAGHSRVKCLEP